MDKIWEFLVVLTNYLSQPIFTIKGVAFSIVDIMIVVLIVLLSFMISRIIRSVLKNRVMPRFKIEMGMQYTLLRLLHYAIIALGIITALNFLKIDLTGLTVFAGLLSVGIGFGLQNITSNFISGIILLFERPIKVNDRITVGDVNGFVEEIRMRATTIRTLDNIYIIVPNSDFISKQVINWSFGSLEMRLRIPIGVAYGSDVPKVRKLLEQAATENNRILKEPSPEVRFRSFGDSSLNFELLVWIPRPRDKGPVSSELYYAIDDIFRKNNVTIPFPQRDIHIISGDLK